MPAIAKRLANALEKLKAYQDNAAHPSIVRSQTLSSSDREVLVQAGYLFEIMKGWWLAGRPDVNPRDSAAWYPNFWLFASLYLKDRFKDEFCLSAEHSLLVLTADQTVPTQIVVMVNRRVAQKLDLKLGSSIFMYPETNAFPKNRVEERGLWVMSMPEALSRTTETHLQKNPVTVTTALRAVDKDALKRKLIDGGHSKVAGWVAGGWRALGFADDADDLVNVMSLAGFKVAEKNPFSKEFQELTKASGTKTPHALRIEAMWAAMRESVVKLFGEPPARKNDKERFLAETRDIFTHDAYNSLSIEGFRVTAELIEKVRTGSWHSDKLPEDMQTKNALAARGYRYAFDAVMESIGQILSGADPSDTVRRDHRRWYAQMFEPMVQMNIIKPADLAGYRRDTVIIANARHVPPQHTSVSDCMETLFGLVKEEKHPAVRAALAHVFYEYIHPYIDGNGRTGRFLMNVLFAAGGYPWVIVPFDQRKRYLEAMGSASERGDAAPLSELLLEGVRAAPTYRDTSTEKVERYYSRRP